MSRTDLNDIKQRLEGIEYVLGQLRIDQKTMLRDQQTILQDKATANSITELKTSLNNINIKLDKDITPYMASISLVINTLTNIDKNLLKINDNISKNKEILDILKERIPINISGYSQPTPIDPTTIDRTLQERIEKERFENLINGLNNIFLKEEQILTKIEFQTQRVIGKLEGINNISPISSTDEIKELKRLQEELITTLNQGQFSGKLQEIWELGRQNSARIDISTTKILNELEKTPVTKITTESNSIDLGPKLSKYLNDKFGIIIPTLSSVSTELQKQQKQLFEIENNTEYIRSAQQDPIDQSTTHKKLDDIEILVNSINLTDIQKQITKIFQETTDQTDFTQRLAAAIKIGIHDRLTRIEDNLYKFITTYKPTTSSSHSAGIIGQTTKVTETYYVHINGQAPDRTHFIQ